MDKTKLTGQPTLADSIEAFSSAVAALAELAPERMSLPQLLFFLLAAQADLRGTPTTFSNVREALGDSVGRSVNTTYKVLLEPTRTSSNGLGWLLREVDSQDERVRYLRLSKKGLAVAAAVDAALNRRS